MATAVRTPSRLEKRKLRSNGIARAVRIALATSASLLALSGGAQAGACVPAVPTANDTVECDGIFTNTIAYAVDDLTVVIGGNDPATTVTTVGEDGITLTDNAGGFVYLYVYGDVTSDMATAYGVNVIDVRADGDITIRSDGDLVLLGDNQAYGSPNVYATAMIAYSYDGTADIGSNGSITSSTDNLIAYGMVARAYGISVVSNGDYAELDVSSDNNVAMGMLAISTYSLATARNFGDMEISGGGPLRSAGAFAISYQGDAAVVNTGTMTVTASGATAQGMAAVANNGDAFAYNSGSIDVDGALASFGLVATGAYAELENHGDVVTSSDQNATALRARGAQTYATLQNTGDVSALAGAGFNAYAIASIGYYGADAVSSGSASAEVAGATGTATGVLVQSAFGDVYFGNDGDVLASGGAYAIGVKLDAYGDGLLVNTGSITAVDGAVGSYAVVSGAGDDSIENHGDLGGALDTGDGGDLLLNLAGATWSASGTSLFGNGDDGIDNDGVIDLSDAFIDMGAGNNQFANTGVVNVSGTGDLVATGGSVAFVNDGLLDFRNGVAGDVLGLAGDLAGDGRIGLDVSGLDGSADQLFIDGDVVPGSTSALDIQLLDLPAQGGFDIPLVQVSGDSLAGNFALGEVAYDSGGLLDVGFSLVSAVDAGNASDDVYSLRMELLGLGEAGAIAAAAAPGVQVLMHSVVGTLAQRNVSLGDAPVGRFGAFARVYRNSGTICPGHSAEQIGDGSDLCFEQRNSGGETGFDFAGTDKFSFGLLLGKAGADQKLQSGGARSEVEGDVKGAFGTMRLPRGIYADLSHRRVDFDVNMRTPSGPLATTGTAETTNAETGYKWRSKNGLVLEGQYQAMRTKLVSVGPVGSAVEFASKPDLSVITRLGLSATKYFKPGPSGTLWEMHANANFIRESHAENDYVIDGELQGSTDLSGNSTMLEIGFTGRRGLLLMFGGLTWQDGGALENFIGGTLGAKYTW